MMAGRGMNYNCKSFRLVGDYAPQRRLILNDSSGPLETFLVIPKTLVDLGTLNAILEAHMDRVGSA